MKKKLFQVYPDEGRNNLEATNKGKFITYHFTTKDQNGKNSSKFILTKEGVTRK